MKLLYLPVLPLYVYVAGLVAFLVAVLLVLTKRWHGHFSMDDLVGVQKNHSVPTPRIGGVSVVAGVIAAYAFAPSGSAEILGTVLLAGVPAFVFGLAEDVTKRVGVTVRLLATMASGVLGWILADVSLSRVDVPVLDAFLIFTTFSVVFTAVAVGGVANAVNIIDGFNGLASGVVFTALFGLAVVSAMLGDMNLAYSCAVIALATLGFLLTNWPVGHLFLGDGGSYFCGFALAWTSVLLIERNSGVSAFVPLLICIHPITEVLFSIFRRQMVKASPGKADRMHLHTLIMRRVTRPWLGKMLPGAPEKVARLSNSVTGLLFVLATMPAVLLAPLVVNNTPLAALACLIFTLVYVAIYARLVLFRWCSPITFLFVRPDRVPKSV